MILIVTNKEDYTADFLILGLHQQSIDFVRLNTEDFPQKIEIAIGFDKNIVSGYLKINGRTIAIHEITSVWYRRPVPSIPADVITDLAAREFVVAESSATLDGFLQIIPCFWVSHPDNLRRAESKILQLYKASQIGFVTPQTLITNIPDISKSFYENYKPSVVYKPQRRGQIVRDENLELIYTNVISPKEASYFENVRLAPVLLQSYIPKSIELRVTVVGSAVFAVALHSQEIEEARHDWRRVDAHKIRHSPYDLPESIRKYCVDLVRSLDIAFGAIDLILTPDGQYVFLEINPNGQWAWIQQLCPEIHIREALIDILKKGRL